MTEDNPTHLDPHPADVQPAFVPEPFKLVVGQEYKLYCKLIMKVVHEDRGKFLAVVPGIEGQKPNAFWYFSDGRAERDLDKEPEQDPYDVKGVHRLPDTIYLIRLNGDYTSNNCFRSYEKAAIAAQDRGGYIVPFTEVIED